MPLKLIAAARTAITITLLFTTHAIAAPSPATTTYAPGTHSINPDTLNQPGFFVLFAFIGAAMVVASIWFFFWAKNGGFVWREGDWDDYKSTVLRRKGPDGRTLTNATKSTKLGGRSVKGGNSIWGKSKWGKSEKGGGRGWDEEDALTEATGWEGEYRDEKVDPSSKHKSRRGGGKARGHIDEELLAYRAEQPARVGGLNSAPEGHGSHYAYSSTGNTNTTSHHVNPATKLPMPLPTQQPKRKSFLTKQREAKASKRAEKRAKEDIARARKEREEYIYNAKPTKARPQSRNGPPAPPPHRTRRNSAETVATSTVFSASEVSSITDKKKEVASSYYDSYRPSPAADRHSRPRSRDASRTRGERERSSSRTPRPADGRERDRERSRSHSRTRGGSDNGSRQSSPRKTRSRFPPSSYNGSDISGDGERRAATTPRFAHPQVPDLRATTTTTGLSGGLGLGAYSVPTGRRAGGYANRFKDSLSDSEDEDDGDLGGMRRGGGGRKW